MFSLVFNVRYSNVGVVKVSSSVKWHWATIVCYSFEYRKSWSIGRRML